MPPNNQIFLMVEISGNFMLFEKAKSFTTKILSDEISVILPIRRIECFVDYNSFSGKSIIHYFKNKDS